MRALEEAVEWSFSFTIEAAKAGGIDVGGNMGAPGVHSDSVVPNGPKESCITLGAVLAPDIMPKGGKGIREEASPFRRYASVEE